MKKLYTIAAAALMGLSALANVSLPYDSGEIEYPKDVVSDNDWTRKNGGAESSWAPFGTGADDNHNALRQWNGATTANAQDDWVTSPAFDVTAGKTYECTFYFKTHNASTTFGNFDVHYTTVNPIEDAAAVAATPKLLHLEGYSDGLEDWAQHTVSAVADADGKAYFTFHVDGSVKAAVYISAITIAEKEDAGEDPGDEPGDEGNGLPVPFNAPIADATGFINGWTTIDANGDGDTHQWLPEKHTSADDLAICEYGAKYTWYSTLGADDYLISPAIHFEAGKEYKVMFWYHTTGSDRENFKVFASTDAGTAEAIQAGTELANYYDVTNKYYVKEVVDFNPATTGDYHISFYLYSPKSRYNVFICGVEVVENVFTPGFATGITVTPDPARELSATITWTLPTVDMFGDPIAADRVFEKVEIFRDDDTVPCATLAGDATEWTDTEASGLTSGKHFYTVAVTVDGATSNSKFGPSKYIGPIMPAVIPCTFSTLSQDDYEMWSVIKGENSTVPEAKTFYYYDLYNAAEPHVRYEGPANSVEDDWFITPPIAVATPGAYRVSIDQRHDNANIFLHAYVGNTPTPEGMTEERPCAWIMSRGVVSFDFYAEEAGTYYVGLHADGSGRATSNTYYIYSLAVAPTDVAPSPVTNLSVVPVEMDNAATLTFDFSDMSLAGTQLNKDDIDVEIYDGTTLIQTVPGEDLTVGTNNVQVAVAEAGVHTFKVKTVMGEISAPEVQHPSVKSSWIGSRELELPYSINFTSTDDTKNIWEAIDVNGDQKTWSLNSTYGLQLVPGELANSVQPHNDYALSPFFSLEPGYYKVSILVSGGQSSSYSTTKLKFKMGHALAGFYDKDNLPELLGTKEIEIASSTTITIDYPMHITEEGVYQIAFFADEPNPYCSSQYNYVAIRKFDIAETIVLPAVATDLTVTPATDRSLSATVSWTNPIATNLDGVELDAIEKAVIYRNSTEIATVTEGLVPGQTSSYVDTEMGAPGEYTYKVEIYNANGKSTATAPSVKSTWIGGGTVPPYSAASSTEFTGWTTINANNDFTSWGDECTWTAAGDKGMALTSTSKDADDWLISPKFEMQLNSVYKITVKMRQAAFSEANGMDTPMQLLYGEGTLAAGYRNIAKWTLFADAISGSEQIEEFYVQTPKPAVAEEEGEEPAEPAAMKARALSATDDDAEEPAGLPEGVQARKILSDLCSFAVRCTGKGDLYLLSFEIEYVCEAPEEDPNAHYCEGTALPYSSTFSSGNVLSNEWTVVDVNNDGKTWAAATESNIPGVKYPYNSSLPADDYIISQLFHFEGGKEYKINFDYRGGSSSYKENLAVFVAEGQEIADIQEGFELFRAVDFYANSYISKSCNFTPEHTGDYCVAFWCYSGKDKMNVWLTNFSIMENKFVPAPVSNFTAVRAANREMRVDLEWTLPTVDMFGDAIAEERVFEKVEIFRDDAEEPAATLAGDATSWIDTEETGLTVGKHTYTVIVTVDGEASAPASVTTLHVGPIAPTAVPVTFTVPTQDDFEMWTVVIGENSTTNFPWKWYDTGSDPNNFKIRNSTYSNTTEDDWLITPPMNITDPGYYRVTSVLYMGSDAPSLIELAFGRSINIDEMTVMGSTSLTRSPSDLVEYDFYASEAGTYYAAFHAACVRGSSNDYYLLNTHVEAVEFVPAPVTDVTITPMGEQNVARLTWKNAATDFAGQPIDPESYSLQITLNGDSLTTIAGTALLTDGSDNSYRAVVPEAGIYTFGFKTVSNTGASAPKTVELKSAWIGARSVALPYTVNFAEPEENPTSYIWDFVDANADGTTWIFNGWSGLKLNPVKDDTTGQATYGDYLVSPKMHLTPGYYKFSYEMRGGSDSGSTPVIMTYTVGHIAAGTFDAENIEWVGSSERTIQSSSYGIYTDYKIAVETEGDYQFVFECVTPANYTMYNSAFEVRNINVTETLVLPALATEVTVTPAADSRREATISWLNPTESNIENRPLANGEITKAVIYRDGYSVGEVTTGLVPGATSSFVDTDFEKSGKFTYYVELYTEGGKSEGYATRVTSPWIGPGLSMPYTANSVADFEQWTLVNNSTTGGKNWTVYNGGFLELYSSNINDAYAFTPYLYLESPSIYKVELKTGNWSASTTGPERELKVFAGREPKVENLDSIYQYMLSPLSTRYDTGLQTNTFYVRVLADGLEVDNDNDEPSEGEMEDGAKIANVPAGNNVFGLWSAATGDICFTSFEMTFVRTVTGLDEILAKNGMVYADGKLQFAGKADIEIYNVAGMLVAFEKGAEGSYSLEALQQGAYIVKMALENGKSLVVKIVK